MVVEDVVAEVIWMQVLVVVVVLVVSALLLVLKVVGRWPGERLLVW